MRIEVKSVGISAANPSRNFCLRYIKKVKNEENVQNLIAGIEGRS